MDAPRVRICTWRGPPPNALWRKPWSSCAVPATREGGRHAGVSGIGGSLVHGCSFAGPRSHAGVQPRTPRVPHRVADSVFCRVAVVRRVQRHRVITL